MKGMKEPRKKSINLQKTSMALAVKILQPRALPMQSYQKTSPLILFQSIQVMLHKHYVFEA
ncbi:MAG: hypothetical protein SPD56_01705 [Alloprevotella sp.]|nr:hypothetical protein [Alloprevotella sp.]